MEPWSYRIQEMLEHSGNCIVLTICIDVIAHALDEKYIEHLPLLTVAKYNLSVSGMEGVNCVV
jgi:hypothetical protein